MKKLITYFLTAMMFINTCGYVIIYWKLKKVYKQSIFQKIEAGELDYMLEEIVVNKNEIGTVKIIRIEEREIKYFGKMYDIVKEYEKDGKIHFLCVNDEKEDLLDKYFEENYESKKDNKADKNPVKNILKYDISFALVDDNNLMFYSAGDMYSSRKTVVPPNFIIEIQTPPPQTG